MKTSLISSGSVLTGALASACCIGPLVLSFLGLGGVAFAAALEPYRPVFIGITFLFLAVGFYFAYRPQPDDCEPGEACATPQSRKTQRLMLWIVTVLALLLVAFPYVMPYLPL